LEAISQKHVFADYGKILQYFLCVHGFKNRFALLITYSIRSFTTYVGTSSEDV
jgi:hypothetical protein